MFKYALSGCFLTNFLFQQVSSDPNALFPKETGWRVYLPYGFNKEISFLEKFGGIIISDKKEAIFFIPINIGFPDLDIRQVQVSKIGEILHDCGLSREIEYRIVFLTDQAGHENLITKLERTEFEKNPVLLISEEGIRFIQGKFDNLRTTFRINKLNLDPDLISVGLLQFPRDLNDRLEIVLLFQGLFHFLNRSIIKGEKGFSLETWLNSGINGWEYIHKNKRWEIAQTVCEKLEILVPKFFSHIIEFNEHRKNETAKSKWLISIKNSTVSPKFLKNLRNAQAKALDWLRRESQQIEFQEQF